MTPTDLATIAGFMAALSVASERLVEIIKGFVPFPEQKNDDDKLEGRRRAILHLLALIAGVISARLVWGVIAGGSPAEPGIFPGTWWSDHSNLGSVAVGFLAAGGSSFWNSILGYANKLKELKKVQAEDVQEEVNRKKKSG